MARIIPVCIYADTTGQFTDEEILAMQETNDGPVVTIPVPEDLMTRWWKETFADESTDGNKFFAWDANESMTYDYDTLYHWLVNHGYEWHRLKSEEV